MPVWQHLEALRKVVFRCLLIIVIGTSLTYNFSEHIVLFLEQPLLNILPEGQKHLYFTGITDKFFIYLKVSVYAAIALTSPFLLMQVWSFVAPALYSKERKVFYPFLFLGTISFFVGMAFAYWVVIPSGYEFLVKFGPDTERPMITVTEYFSLTLQLLLGLGVVFELPVVLMILAKLGIVNTEVLGKARPYAYVLLAVLAAIITPTPDAFTMLLVLIPLGLLYETSLLLVRWVVRTPAV